MGLLDYIEDEPSLFGGVLRDGYDPSRVLQMGQGDDDVSAVPPTTMAQMQGQSPSGRPRVNIFAPWSKQPAPADTDSFGNDSTGPQLRANSVSALGLDNAEFDRRFAVGNNGSFSNGNIQSNMQSDAVGPSRFGDEFNPQSFAGESSLPSRLLQRATYNNANVKGFGTAPENIPTSSKAEEYVSYIVQHESKGKLDAKSTTSSATGPGQFIAKTWLDSLQKYRPDIGGTVEEKLALRSNPTLALQMTKALTTENADALEKAKIEPTAGNTYLAHFAGSGKAIKILKADPSTPVTELLGPAAMKANKFLENMTAGDMQKWASDKMAAAQKQLEGKAAKNGNSIPAMTRAAPVAFSGMLGQSTASPRGAIDLSKLGNNLRASGNPAIFLGR